MADYYAVLGVQPTDSEETIRQQYRKLAKEYHPDLHPGDRDAEERFKEIGEAWGVLGDTDKRKQYDAVRAKQGKKSAAKTPGTNVKVDFDDLMNGFDRFFGKGSAQPKDSVQNSKAANPLDASDLFSKYMGLGKQQKK